MVIGSGFGGLFATRALRRAPAEVGTWAEGEDQAGLSATGSGAVRVLRATDGGHASRSEDVLQRAIEAGAEPEALVEAINRAKEERDAALIELDRVPVTRTSSSAEVDASLDHLSVLGRNLRHAEPEDLQRFYGNCGSTWPLSQKKGPWM